VDPGSIPGISTKRNLMTVFDLPWWQLMWGFAILLNYLYWIFIHRIIFDGDDKVSTWRANADGNRGM
jgi:hypothetical protein